MDILLIFCARLIGITLNVVSYAMMARALLPLIIDAEGTKIYTFVTVISEPFIIPVRFLLYKYNILQDSPIDWSFMISYILIVLLSSLLPAI